jgi:hypothetical protein
MRIKIYLIVFLLNSFCSVQAQTLPAYLPSSGLVGWWPFNGNATDQSGNGNNGTVNNAISTPDRTSTPGNAYSFGASRYISVSSSASLGLANSDFTISSWIKLDSLPNIGSNNQQYNQYYSILGKRQYSSCDANYSIGISSPSAPGGGGKIVFVQGPAGCGNFAYSNAMVAAGNWNNVAATFSNTTKILKLYLNGNLVFSQSNFAISGTNSSQLWFGNDVSGYANYFPGSIDDIGIWSRELSSQELLQVVNGCYAIISPSAPSICQGQSITLTANNGSSYLWNNGSTTSSIIVSPSQTTSYSVMVTDAQNCTSTANVTVIVNTNNNSISLSSAAGTNAQTRCVNSAINNITYNTTGASGAVVSGLPNGVNGSWGANVFTISGTPTVSGTFNYTVTLTGGCTGGANTATGTITVTPNNTIALSSAAGTNAQTRCISTAITNITYATTGATGASVTGLPAGVTGSWSANVFTISGTPTSSGTFNYNVNMTGGCTGGVNSIGGSIIVNSNTIALSSAAGTNSQTACINNAINNIAYTTTRATGATVSGLPAGVTGSWLSNVFTISGTPTVSGTFNYIVTMTGGCPGVANTATGSIKVNSTNNTISLSSAQGTNAQSLCINTPITNISYSTTGASGATVTGLPSGVTGSWSANVFTISGTPTVSGVFNYTVTMTGGCTSGANSASGVITANANNSIAITSTRGGVGRYVRFSSTYSQDNGQVNVYGFQVYSGGANVALNKSTTTYNGGTASAAVDANFNGSRWSSNRNDPGPDDLNPHFFVVDLGAQFLVDSIMLNISGFDNWRQVFTISISSDNLNWSQVGARNNVTGIFSFPVNISSVCINNPISSITYSTTGATGASVTGLPAGVTGSWSANVFTVSGTPTVSGTFNYTVTMTGGCTGGTNTATGTITVTPNNTIALISVAGTSAQSLCLSTAITNITYTTTGATGASVTGLPAGVTGSWSANVFTISGTPTVSGTFNYTVTMTGGCTGGTNTATGTITVTPNNTIALSSAAGTNAQTRCLSTAITNITYATTGATGASITGLPAGVTGSWSANVFTISGTPTVSGTFNYTVTMTGGCTGGTNTATGSIIVNSQIVPLFSAIGPYCNGANIPALPTNSNNGISGSWSPAINNTTTTTYTFTPDSGQCATGTMLTITINTLAVPVINAGGPLVFCAGDSVILTSSYLVDNSWSNGSTSQSIVVRASGNFFLTVVASGCTLSSNPVSVVVNPTPVLFSLIGGGTFCNTGSQSGISLNLSGSQSNVTYQFQNSGGTVITNLPGTGLPLVAENIGNSGIYKVIATNNSSSCQAEMTGTVLVTALIPSTWYQDNDQDGYGSSFTLLSCQQPEGYVSNSGDCNDQNVNIYPGAVELCNSIDDNCNGTVDEGCQQFTYYADADGDSYGNPNSPLVTSSTSSPAGYVVNSSDCNDTRSSSYPGAPEVCNGFDDNCDGFIDNGVPALSAPTQITGPSGVCRGAINQTFSVAAVNGASSYIWTLPTGATGSSTTNSITVSFSSTYVTGNICVRAINSCGQSPSFCRAVTYLSTIPGRPGTISGQASAVCSTFVQTYSVAAVTNATTYTWMVPVNSNIISGQGTNQVVVQFAAGFTTGNLSVTSGNCIGNSAVRTLLLSSVPPTPVSIVGPLNTVCAGSTKSYNTAAIAGATSYIWTVPAGAVINSGQGTNAITVTFPNSFSSGAITVRSATACTTSAARSITVYSIPIAPASITGASVGLCGVSTQTYTCSASTTGATSYNWTVPANAVINGGLGTTSISVTFPSGFTTGNVSVTASNSCGTSTARTLAVASKTAQPGTITGITTNLCGGGTYTYSIAAVSGASSYTWIAPSGCTISGSSSGTSVNLVVPSGFVSGTLSVAANNACGASTAKTTTLSGRPATPTTLTGPTSVCASSTGHVYTTTAVTGATSYVWTVPSGASIISGNGTNSITVNWGAVAGTVTVKAGNACGVNSTAKTLAVALATCRFGEEETATDQSDLQDQIRLFPNPSSNNVNLEIYASQTSTNSIRITDMLGKVLIDESRVLLSGKNSFIYDMSPYASGLYLVNVSNGNNQQVIKLVKE